jgi:hypothetical protein
MSVSVGYPEPVQEIKFLSATVIPHRTNHADELSLILSWKWWNYYILFIIYKLNIDLHKQMKKQMHKNYL